MIKSLQPIKKGICVQIGTKRAFHYIEYKSGVKISRRGLVDGIMGKEYFEKNYEVKR